MDHHVLFRIPDSGRNRTATLPVKEDRKIAVLGTGPGSGVSLTAGLLVSWLRQHVPGEAVTLIEMGSSYFYEAYGVEKRFMHRDFYRFYELMAQKSSIKGLSNMEEGINWVLRCPEDSSPGKNGSIAAAADMLRLVYNIAGTLRIFDCSGVPIPALWEVLPEMDAVICVVDPLPSKLIPAASEIERLRLECPRGIWVINKMNSGVHRGELKRFLGGVDWVEIPSLAPEHLYRAQYNCVLPYTISPVRQQTDRLLEALWRRICSME